MKKILLLFLIIITSATMHAQQKIAGEYYLQGVMETASGFKLEKIQHSNFSFHMVRLTGLVRESGVPAIIKLF